MSPGTFKKRNPDNSFTREGQLWYNMLARVRPGSKQSINNPRYQGCTVSPGFADFQVFAQWCHNQIGFNSIDENGNRWQLDKDLLIKGNKLYSESTCVFLPQQINTFLVKTNARRGNLPIGVSLHKSTGKFEACLNDLETRKLYLGLFLSVDEAFSAYKESKERLARLLAEKWSGMVDARAVEALSRYTVDITD